MVENSVRLMILDDDANQLKTLGDALALEGFNIDGFKSGKKALEMASQVDYAAALIDLKLPDMSGLEVLSEMKLKSPDTECILLTGYASQETAIEAVNFGAFAFFTKPYQIEQLILAVRRSVEKRNVFVTLRESEERFRKLYENSPNPYQSLDPEGKILAVNNAWLEELGYKSEEVLGKWFGDLLPDVQKQLFKGRFEKFKVVGETHYIEFDIKRKSGDLITISFDGRASLDEKGKFLRSHCIFTNITNRKNAENALRYSQELLRFILKHDPNAIAVYDNDLHYIAVSDRYLKDYNVREGDILGKHHYEVFPEMPQKWKDVHSRCLAGAIERNDDDYFERPDGTITYNRWECRPWLKADGNIGGIITYTEVTTERKKYEQEIIRQSEQVAIINEMGQALAQTMDLKSIYNHAYHYAGELVDRPNFSISLINKKNQTLEAAFLISDNQEMDISKLPLLPINPKLKGGRSGAINKIIPVIINDLEQETEKDKKVILIGSDEKPKSALYVPMVVDGKVIGLLEVQSYKKGAYDKEDAELLGIAANAIGLAISNTRLFEDLRLQSTALSAAANAIVITDINGTIEWINPAFCELTGYAEKECLGKNPSDLVRSGQTLEPTYKILWDTILAGKVWNGTLINRRKDGSFYTEEQTITPMKNEKGEITKFIGIKMDVTEREQRERELIAITNISAALRKAPTRSELLPILLDELVFQMKIDGASLEILDIASGELLVEIGRGIWDSVTGKIIPPGSGISAAILKSGKPYLDNNIANNERLLFKTDFVDCRAAASVPLFVQNQIIGLLWIGSRRKLNAYDMRLLNSVADIAANAIHRASLHEETQTKVQQLNALRTIDQAINSSLDLRVTLGVVLNQATQIINTDAIAILIYNKQTLSLDYAAGRGFKYKNIEDSHVRIGSGLAGKTALERRIMSVTNFQDFQDEFTRKSLMENEGFAAYHAAPLIVKGEIQGVLEVFHRSKFLANDEWLEMLGMLATQTAITIDNNALFNGLQRSNFNLTQSYDKTIEGWSKALDLRDNETEGHTLRVTELTLKLARLAGISEENLVHVRRGALLHDIGKMGVPDSVLLKPDKLTEEEWVIMRKHPELARDLISSIPYLSLALDIPYCHHEKWDGSGYPRGLKDEAIPLAARLFAVIDVFDALTSDRPYRKAWDVEKAKAYIREQSGTHFDPKAVELFERLNYS